jgi:hypothetical protein
MAGGVDQRLGDEWGRAAEQRDAEVECPRAPRMIAACHFDAWRGGGGDASMVSATALADSVSTRAAG